MSVETHYVCDVCGKRQQEVGQNKSEELRNWWGVNVHLSNVYNALEKQNFPTSQWGYVCSMECMEKLIEKMKGLINKH